VDIILVEELAGDIVLEILLERNEVSGYGMALGDKEEVDDSDDENVITLWKHPRRQNIFGSL
jgi:hypothetical protein